MGRQAEDLENQLRHFVVGQEEAIHGDREGIPDLFIGTITGWQAYRQFFFSLGLRVPGKLASWRPPPNPC